MSKIGNRLREERTRLGMTQGSFAIAGGVQANAQGKYERGERSPNALYLVQLLTLGVDTFYVVTGSRTTPRLSDNQISEQNFLQRLSILSEREKKAVLNLMKCVTKER
ncbi:helix-turn-helix domain-containing protein [Pseudomonas veronii]|uniref:helix-turn-helix domain-containing protein n=1 Tax=Pseudomonas veronii TaxID=76761 RepID=UPI00061DCB27|nr:helix-turn-helix transcriptional regulator [Pseudomonas veronii]